jgi:hypothetical protein
LADYFASNATFLPCFCKQSVASCSDLYKVFRTSHGCLLAGLTFLLATLGQNPAARATSTGQQEDFFHL